MRGALEKILWGFFVGPRGHDTPNNDAQMWRIRLYEYFINNDARMRWIRFSDLSNNAVLTLYIALYWVFHNKSSQHYCVVHAMEEFLSSRRGYTVFCVPCCFYSGGCQNTWTRLMCNMYGLEERVFFVKSYYRTQKNLKEVLCLYREQFNVPRHKWPSKSIIIT